MEKVIFFLQALIDFNEKLFLGIDKHILNLAFPQWIESGVIDSLHMLPFLFLTFLFIEILEYFYSEKIKDVSKYSKITGPLFGALIATFPQCGFSVIAAGLYTKRIITAGTLIAVFISTSDESLPILLASPKNLPLVLPIVATKIVVAVIAGYLIDFIFKPKPKPEDKSQHDASIIDESSDIGCCRHNITKSSKKDIALHPVMHTLNIFVFILLITLLINYVFSSHAEALANSQIISNKYLQIITTSFIGLIPNCAASVLITLLYIKGSITFSAVISGLCASSGLGLLVLFKRNSDIKDTLRIIFLVLLASVFAGLMFQIIN